MSKEFHPQKESPEREEGRITAAADD